MNYEQTLLFFIQFLIGCLINSSLPSGSIVWPRGSNATICPPLYVSRWAQCHSSLRLLTANDRQTLPNAYTRKLCFLCHTLYHNHYINLWNVSQYIIGYCVRLNYASYCPQLLANFSLFIYSVYEFKLLINRNVIVKKYKYFIDVKEYVFDDFLVKD